MLPLILWFFMGLTVGVLLTGCFAERIIKQQQDLLRELVNLFIDLQNKL